MDRASAFKVTFGQNPMGRRHYLRGIYSEYMIIYVCIYIYICNVM